MSDDDDIMCDCCENTLASMPEMNDDYDYVDEDGDKWEDLSDFYQANEIIALWHSDGIGGSRFICIDCVTYAYEDAFGVPYKKRLRKWLVRRIRWYYRLRRKIRGR